MLQEIQITNFTAGEGSPKMKGRTDYAKYFNMNDIQRNLVTIPQGGATKRPGTMFSAFAKDQSATPMRVVQKPFIFSTIQAYTFEIGYSSAAYIRVYMDEAPVLNVQSVSGAADNGSGLVRLTLAATAGLQTGNTMIVTGVGGTTEANGTWPITLIDGTHVDLVGSAFVHTYTSGGSTSTPVEILLDNNAVALPYLLAELPALKHTQSFDTFYLLHPKHPPATLTRTSHTQWTYAAITFLDGPYLTQNQTGSTVTVQSVSGTTYTLEWSDTTPNNGAGFSSSDVGRMLRLLLSNGATSTWAWGTIASVISTTEITIMTGPAVANGANTDFTGPGNTSTYPPAGYVATPAWQLGAFTPALGYPGSGRFWQQRLILAGTTNQPNGAYGSQIGNYIAYSPTANDGTVTAIQGFAWVLEDQQANAIGWISAAGSAQAQQLALGTQGAEHIIQQANASQSLSAVNVQSYAETTYGSAPNVIPLHIGKSLLFVDFSGRKVIEWSFYWQMNGYDGVDKTQTNDHLTTGPEGSNPSEWGIRWWDYQQNPHRVIWAGLNNGKLISFTYDRDQDIWAGAEHVLGGQYYGGVPIVESGCVIPSPDQTYSELWLTVLRTINGTPTRFIEVMTRYFDRMPQDQAWFVDCAIASLLTMPSAIMTPPANLVTPPADNGTLAQTMLPAFTGTGNFSASGAVFAGTSADIGIIIRVNGGSAIVTAPVSTSVVTAQVLRPLSSLAPAASGTWSATAASTSFSGLSYLDGETVGVNGDGGDLGRYTPSAGTITLNNPASYAIAGLPYSPVLVTMPFEPQRAAQAACSGKLKGLKAAWVRFYESAGFYVARRYTDPQSFAVNDNTPEMALPSVPPQIGGQAPPLLSSITQVNLGGSHDREGQIVITQDAVLPLTIIGIFATAEVSEMPNAA